MTTEEHYAQNLPGVATLPLPMGARQADTAVRFFSRLLLMMVMSVVLAAAQSEPPPAGAIGGRVLDEAELVLRGAHVRVARRFKYWNGPYYEATVLMSDETDHAGRFRLHSLPPGDYVVSVDYSPPGRDDWPYPRTYYPGTPKIRDAVIVKVSAFQTTEIEIRLPPNALRVVTGRVRRSNGAPAARVEIRLRSHDLINDEEWTNESRQRPIASTKSGNDGRFQVRVLPGEYILFAADKSTRRKIGDPFELTERVVNIPEHGAATLNVALTPAANVSGRIEWAGTGPPPWPRPGARSLGRIRLQGAEYGEDYGGLDTDIRPDGTFEFANLYGLRGILPMGVPFAIKSIEGAAGIVDQRFIRITPGADVHNLRLVLTNEVCYLSTSVIDETGAPVAASIVVMPEAPSERDSRSWGFLYAGQTIMFNGRSTLRLDDILYGRYLVAAIDVEPARLTGDTDLMLRARAAATLMELDRRNISVELRVVRLRPFVHDVVEVVHVAHNATSSRSIVMGPISPIGP